METYTGSYRSGQWSVTAVRAFVLKHRVLLLILLAVVGLAGSWLLLEKRAELHDRSWRLRSTLQLVGLVALGYLSDRGSPPTSVADLFNAGYLRHESDGAVWMYRFPGELSGTVPGEYLSKVEFCFPSSADGYAPSSTGVLDRKSQTDLQLIRIPCEEIDRTEEARINGLLATAWLRIMQGEPSGQPWVDEPRPNEEHEGRAPDLRASTSQPQGVDQSQAQTRNN